MANPVLGKLQGQGLIETTTAGLQQAGAQLATTPVGAALQGRGPDSLKMAGTPPAKINAMAAGMKDVSSVALSQLRETSRILEGTAAEAATVARAQNATIAGRVDNAIAARAQKKILENWATMSQEFEGLGLKEKELMDGPERFTADEIKALNIALKELQQGGQLKDKDGNPIPGSDGLTGADIDLINRALKGVGSTEEVDFKAVDGKMPSANALATTVSGLYKEDTPGEIKEKIKKALVDAKDTLKIGTLNDDDAKAIFGDETSDTTDLINLLVNLTGKDEAAVKGMTLAELRTTIDSWKQSEFKDVETLRKTLAESGPESARGKLALQELRRLGQVGVTAADAKVNDLQKQIREGDKVTINGKSVSVDELFSDPELLVQMSSWIEDPTSAPKDLQGYLTANKNGIDIAIANLLGAAARGDVQATGLTGAMQRVSDNITAGAVHESIKNIPVGTVEKFFPGWSSFGLDAKIPASEDAYKASAGDNAVAAALKANPALTPEEQAKIREQATSPEVLAKDPEYNKYMKYKVLQDKDLARNAEKLLTNLEGLDGVDGKTIFDELTPEQLRTLCQSETSVNAFTTGLNNRQRATTFKGDTNFSAEFKEVADKLNLGSTASQFANLVDNDLSPYIEIFQKAGLSNLLDIKVNSSGSGLTRRTWKTAKLNTTALANMVKSLGKASLADVLSGKVSAGIKDLEMLFTKLTQGLSKVEEAVKPIPSEAERDDLFAKSMYQTSHADTSQQKLSKLTSAETTSQREYTDFNNEYLRINNEYNAVLERYSKNADIRNNRQTDEAKALTAELQRLSAALSASQKRVSESKNKYNSAKSAREQFENNRAQYDKERADYKDAWWRGYEKKLNEDNAAIRQTYADLGDIFTGVK
jgi:hypothetical protein